MRWKPLLFMVLSVLLLLTFLPPCLATTLRWDKTLVFAIEDYNTKIKFSSNLYCTQIGWYSDRIKYYGARMGGARHDFFISVQNADLTVTKLWSVGKTDFSLTGSGTAIVRVWNVFKPMTVHVNGKSKVENDQWNYTGDLLTIQCPLSSSGSVNLSWQTNSYSTPTGSGVRVYTGILLKPSVQHQYTLSSTMTFHNVTLDSGTLGLSSVDDAYNIKCTTSDNVNSTIHQWFSGSNYRVKFKPIAESEPSISFTVNTRARGEPQRVSGVSTWTYDDDTTTVTLTASTDSMVIMDFAMVGLAEVEWFWENILMFLGIVGMVLLMLGPTFFVVNAKNGDLGQAFIYLMLFSIMGIGLVIGWLWK